MPHDIVLFGNYVFGKNPYLVTIPITKAFITFFRFPKFNVFGKFMFCFWGFSMFLGSFLGKLCTFLGVLYSFFQIYFKEAYLCERRTTKEDARKEYCQSVLAYAELMMLCNMLMPTYSKRMMM